LHHLIAAAPVSQHPVRRNCEISNIATTTHALGDRNGFTGQCESASIERLRHEGAIAQEKQVPLRHAIRAGHVRRAGQGCQQLLGVLLFGFGAQKSYVNAGVFCARGTVEINEVA
jgi:hypothetical protein